MKTPLVQLNGEPYFPLYTPKIEFSKALNALLLPNKANGEKWNLPDSLLINKTTTGY